MRILKVKLIDKIRRTPTIESFRFLPQEKIDFIPGQFLCMVFDIANENNKELNKHLSFSAPPGKEYIEVTKRLTDSSFSKKLDSLNINDEVLLKAPLGNCVFKDEYKKIGFLIGGIGITPVISIVEYILDKALNTDVCLLYSNRTEDEIAFKQELDNSQSINKNFKISYILTDCQPKDKTCIYGAINKELIQGKVCDLKERVWFIFGPPRMVETLKTFCTELGCDEANIKTESFIGY